MTKSMITTDLTKLGPVAFDTLQAQVEDVYATVLNRQTAAADSLHRANGERGRTRVWGTEWPNTLADTLAQVEADPNRPIRGRINVTAGDALADYRNAVAAVEVIADDLASLLAEYSGRPWPRYVMTQGHNAHIHRGSDCSTLHRGRERTRLSWLIDLSGRPLAECIEKFQATMCTVCYPDAPVVKVVDPNTCQGTAVAGTVKAEWTGGRLSTVARYVGDCTCGKTGIRVKTDGTPAKHKPAAQVEAPAAPAAQVLAAESTPRRDVVTARVDEPAGDEAPATVVPTFSPLDEVEHVGQPGAAWVVEKATNAGRLVVRASGALGVTTRVLAAKCRLLRSAADATATMTRDELVNELVELAAGATDRAGVARLRTVLEVRHGFTSKGGGHVFDRSGYSPCQGWGELANMIGRDRAQAVRIAADTARAVGAVHLRKFVGGVWCGDETPAQVTDERRLATCAACDQAIAFEQLMRGARQDLEAGRPVVDADGEPVELGDLVDSVELRVFFSGRVRGECGHYLSVSERRAGLTTCERCPDRGDGDQGDQGDQGGETHPAPCGFPAVRCICPPASALDDDQDDEPPTAEELEAAPRWRPVLARYSRQAETLAVGREGADRSELVWADAGGLSGRDRALFTLGWVRVAEWPALGLDGMSTVEVRPAGAGDGVDDQGQPFRAYWVDAEQLDDLVRDAAAGVPVLDRAAALAADLQAAWSAGTAKVDRPTAIAVMHKLAELLRTSAAAHLHVDGEPATVVAGVFDKLAGDLEQGDDDQGDEVLTSVLRAAVERQDDEVLTSVLQAAGEPVGEHAQDAPVPAQRPAATFGEQRRAAGDPEWAPGLTARVVESHREALTSLLGFDGFARSASSPERLEHASGVAVVVDSDGTMISYPDPNIGDSDDGEERASVRLQFGTNYGAIRDLAVGLVAIVGGTAPAVTASSAQVEALLALVGDYGQAAAVGGDTRRGVEGMAEAKRIAGERFAAVRAALLELVAPPADRPDHVTRITGPDAAGHWGFECDGCGYEQTGHEWAAEVLAAATSHGPLAADSPVPVDDVDQDDDEPSAEIPGWPANGCPRVGCEKFHAGLPHTHVVEALYLDAAGNRIGDGPIGDGAQLEIECVRYPVPDRALTGGRLASHRIMVALQTAGYRPSTADGFARDGGILVAPAAWGKSVAEARAQIEETLETAGRHGMRWEKLDERLGELGRRLPMPVRELLGQMYAEDVILCSDLPSRLDATYYPTGVTCAECEGNGQNCHAHKSYAQRLRDGH